MHAIKLEGDTLSEVWIFKSVKSKWSKTEDINAFISFILVRVFFGDKDLSLSKLE